MGHSRLSGAMLCPALDAGLLLRWVDLRERLTDLRLLRPRRFVKPVRAERLDK